MSTLIVGRAFEPGVGMCSVESIGNGWFRLIPDSGQNRKIKPRAAIRWRTTKRRTS